MNKPTQKSIAMQKAEQAKAEAARLAALAEAAPDEPLNDEDENAADAKEAQAALVLANAAAATANAAATAAKKKADEALAQLTGVAGKDNRPSATIVAELCHVAGMPDKCAGYILALDAGTTTVEKIRAEIAKIRTEASSDNALSNHHVGAHAGTALDQMTQTALALVKSSNGALNKGKAFEQVLLSNPAMYEQFVDEQCDAINGSRATLRQYTVGLQARCKALGLGTGMAA